MQLSLMEFRRRIDAGFWDRISWVELIGGEVRKVARHTPTHYWGTHLAMEALRGAFGDGYWVRPRGLLSLTDDSEPLPDLAVVPGGPCDYLHLAGGLGHPTSALLVVEVAERTLEYDRTIKGGLYAKAGIADYWIVNPAAGTVEVCRHPVPDKRHVFGHRYAERMTLSAGESVSPLAAPRSVIDVKGLLPERPTECTGGN